MHLIEKENACIPLHTLLDQQYYKPSTNGWRPDSWQAKSASQLPTYPSKTELTSVMKILSNQPPLVSVEKINKLKKRLSIAAEGEAFLLQIGDCAEMFADCTDDITEKKINHLNKMSSIMSSQMNLPIIQVGRLAGQYAKPRSNNYEMLDNISLPVYRGDMINSAQPTAIDRAHDPRRMLRGYNNASKILNHPLLRTETGPEIFVSHEALLLFYEQALTRHYVKDANWYNLSTHFPWIGVRTIIDSPAHLEYAKGISNPLAIKVGPSCSPEKLTQLIQELNPLNIPGRLTLISRLGAGNVKKLLPRLIQTVVNTNHNVLWCCDPMHGNTEMISGVKTRKIENIREEISAAFEVHHELGCLLSGIHLEATHENVMECISDNHSPNIQSTNNPMDPRLNQQQSLDMAAFIASEYKKYK